MTGDDAKDGPAADLGVLPDVLRPSFDCRLILDASDSLAEDLIQSRR